MNNLPIVGQNSEPKTLVRVFPRRNKATPDDPLAFFEPPDMFVEADEVHIDCTFTQDKAKAGELYKSPTKRKE
jgi:hypothetical protein